MTRNAEIGSRIRKARQLFGLTQEQLSQMTGISRSLLDHYENGTRRIHADTVSTICEALNVRPSLILGTKSSIIMLEDFVGKKEAQQVINMAKNFAEAVETMLTPTNKSN